MRTRARRRMVLFWGAVVLMAAVLGPLGAGASESGLAGGASVAAFEGSAETAQALSEATGLAISPLLVLTGKGVYRFWRAEPAARAELPWYASRLFWIPGLIVIVLVFFKEAILGRVIALKKPLDELELVENMASGLLACPVAVQLLTRLLEPAAARTVAGVIHFVSPVAQAASFGGAAAASPVNTLVWVLAALGGFFLFAALWMASQAVNVLLLFSPLGVIDNVVRASRLFLLVGVVILVRLFPAVGIAVCGVLTLVALAVSGWSFRLMVFGAVFSRDVFFSRTATSEEGGVWAFTTHGLPSVPRRTYGRLRHGPAGLELTYRRWMLLPSRTVRIPSEHVQVAAALLSPVVVRIKDPGPYETLEQLFRLPPRYRGAEAKVASALGGLPVRDAPLLKGYKAIRAWIDALVNEGTIHLGI